MTAFNVRRQSLMSQRHYEDVGHGMSDISALTGVELTRKFRSLCEEAADDDVKGRAEKRNKSLEKALKQPGRAGLV